MENDSQSYWEEIYSKKDFFGTGPTKLAILGNEIIKKNKYKKILEIGCGQGRDALHLSHLGVNVDAFDKSHNAIKFVQDIINEQKIQNLHVFQHDVTNDLPFEKNSFDFIYSNLALQFFELQKLKGIISDIANTLEKNSHFLLSTKKEGDKYHNFGNKISDNSYEFNSVIRYFYDKNTLKKLFESFFEIIYFNEDEHINLDSTKSVWWKILLKRK